MSPKIISRGIYFICLWRRSIFAIAKNTSAEKYYWRRNYCGRKQKEQKQKKSAAYFLSLTAAHFISLVPGRLLGSCLGFWFSFLEATDDKNN